MEIFQNIISFYLDPEFKTSPYDLWCVIVHGSVFIYVQQGRDSVTIIVCSIDVSVGEATRTAGSINVHVVSRGMNAHERKSSRRKRKK